MSDPDAVVIGSGPNGLAAACALAQSGLKVLVLEANPRRPGGALASAELTRPGFVHDVGAGFFPFGKSSPAFRALNLEVHGLSWHNARFESCHPALDGSVACIARDVDLTARHFGSSEDGDHWRRLARWHAGIEERLLELLLRPFPNLGPLWQLGPGNVVKLLRLVLSSGRGMSRRLFSSTAARRVLPSLGLHVDVGPDDTFGAALSYMLGLTASTGGYAVPRGGAQSITNAMVTALERDGGRLRLGAEVARIVVREGRARAVRLADGEEIAVGRAILADTGAPKLLLDLVGTDHLPGGVVRRMRRFPHSWGTFKVDWALSGAVPWTVEAARESAGVHVAEDLDDLSRFTREVRAGVLPERPYLVVGQQSLVDPTRAPEGQHTLYCYTHVPPAVDGGWPAVEGAFADRIEARVEGLAPGFRALILERSVSSPLALEHMNPNLVGGDLGGGSNAWHQQLLFRPMFPYFRYRMPVEGLYLCSSYAHPGAGVHGMCGYNAAEMALADLNLGPRR